MRDKYTKIINEIQVARKAGDTKTLKRLERKLERWQAEYGASAPVR